MKVNGSRFSFYGSIRAGLNVGVIASLLVLSVTGPAKAVTCHRGRTVDSYKAMLADFKRSLDFATEITNSQQGDSRLPKNLFIYLQTCGNSHLSRKHENTKKNELPYTRTTSLEICGPVTFAGNAAQTYLQQG